MMVIVYWTINVPFLRNRIQSCVLEELTNFAEFSEWQNYFRSGNKLYISSHTNVQNDIFKLDHGEPHNNNGIAPKA